MWRAHLAAATPSAASAVAGVSMVEKIADPALLVICAVGVPIGVLGMIGIGLARGKPTSELKRDVLVALFMALMNFALAVILAARGHLPYLESLGLAIAVSASNSIIAERFIAKWTREAVPDEGQLRNDDQRLIAAAKLAIREERARDAGKDGE